MDLKEIKTIHINRHPWETARLKALRKIMSPQIFEGIKILDVGCGDGFISKGLFSHIRHAEITAVDIHLSDEMILEHKTLSNGIKYQREIPEEEIYDLILLLDVIEHVENDQGFLSAIVDKHILPNGKVMITAPAFQSIYGRHDTILGHYRRYNLNELKGLTAACGLNVLSSGYLFSSLLIPKYMLYKLLNTGKGSEGVGNWRRGKVVTNIIEKILNIDNSLLISVCRLGIKIPGLTGWVLCEKRG